MDSFHGLYRMGLVCRGCRVFWGLGSRVQVSLGLYWVYLELYINICIFLYDCV